MDEAYRPPQSVVIDPNRRTPRSSVIAIVIGGLGIDFLGTLVAGAGLGIAWSLVAVSRGADPQQITESVSSPGFLISASAVGGLLTVAGGYVAARWARRRPVAHGLGSGALAFVLGLPFFFLPGGTEPQWLTIATVLLHMPLAGAGGYLGSSPLSRP